MAVTSSKVRERLVVSCVDKSAAREPQRIWAARPYDEKDMSRGFEDIAYANLANAVNHASWWLQEVLGSHSSVPFAAFAYQGPSDIQSFILILAAAKIGKQANCSSLRTLT